MSQFAGDDTMSILDSINDGKHYVPKDTQEKQPVTKKKVWLILGIAAVLVLTLLLVRANSLGLSMFFKGIDVTSVSYIVRDCRTNSGNRFSVFHADTVKGEPALVRAVENAFGFWRIDDVAPITEEQPWAYMTWKEPSGHWSFDTGIVGGGSQYHLVFKGTDAAGPVALNTSRIPENTAVHIEQSDSSYIIHLVGFSDRIPETPVRQLLEEGGYVS